MRANDSRPMPEPATLEEAIQQRDYLFASGERVTLQRDTARREAAQLRVRNARLQAEMDELQRDHNTLRDQGVEEGDRMIDLQYERDALLRQVEEVRNEMRTYMELARGARIWMERESRRLDIPPELPRALPPGDEPVFPVRGGHVERYEASRNNTNNTDIGR